MKKLKYQILFTILMMTIGIAAVTTNLSLGGSTELASNTDDFDVYITSIDDISVDSSNNKIVINGKRSFSFVTELQSVNSKMNLDIYLVNASKNYDARMSYTCDYDDEYIYAGFYFEEPLLYARSEFDLGFEVKLLKSYIGDDLEIPVTCSISANAVERASQGSGDVLPPVEGRYSVGSEIAIGDEKFNVIRDNGDGTVSMLAQLGIDAGYVQSDENDIDFGGIADWGTPAEYMDINIQNYNNEIKERINGYVDYLRNFTNDQYITGDLISLKELEELGCAVSEGYGTTYGSDACYNSPHYSWLINGEWMWTKTARIGFDNTLWVMSADGLLSPLSDEDWFHEDNCIYGYHDNDHNTVRPVITISKSILAKYK